MLKMPCQVLASRVFSAQCASWSARRSRVGLCCPQCTQPGWLRGMKFDEVLQQVFQVNRVTQPVLLQSGAPVSPIAFDVVPDVDGLGVEEQGEKGKQENPNSPLE